MVNSRYQLFEKKNLVIVQLLSSPHPSRTLSAIRCLFQVVLDYDTTNYAPPGFVVLEARKLAADGTSCIVDMMHS